MTGTIGERARQLRDAALANPVRAGATLAAGSAAAAAGVVIAQRAYGDVTNLYRNATRGASALNQDITFPRDLLSVNEGRAAFCRLRFSRYVRRSIREQPRLQVESGMRLPLPASGLSETQGVTYDTTDLGPAIGAAADAATSAFNRSGTPGGPGGLGAAVAGIAGGIAAQAYDSAKLFGFQNQARAAISSITGTSINPFQTVTFKAPKFKTHRLGWKLIPRNAQESEDIRAIIELFKYHSSPGISAGPGVFFSYPEILEIQLFPDDAYLYRFKPCVVDSVTVNYAPNGPSIYRGTGAPTAVEINISLQEIEYWTKNDYVGGIF